MPLTVRQSSSWRPADWHKSTNKEGKMYGLCDACGKSPAVFDTVSGQLCHICHVALGYSTYCQCSACQMARERKEPAPHDGIDYIRWRLEKICLSEQASDAFQVLIDANENR